MNGVSARFGTRQLLLCAWLFCSVLGWLAAAALGVWPAGIDDAYIFLVYAENFANGAGFVYNPGGEKVEGFTSLAWVLLFAALARAGVVGPVVLFALCALLAATGLTALLTTLHRQLVAAGQPAAPVLLLAAIWLTALPGWFLWNVAAFMDVVLWGCLLSLFVAVVIRRALADSPAGSAARPLTVSLLCVLMLLTRPEALAWVPFLLVSLALLARGMRRPVLPEVGVPALASLLTVGGLTAFRQSYFGYPLPNTYYAKVSADTGYNLQQGVAYVGEYLTGAGVAGFVWLIAIVLALLRLRLVWQLLAGHSSGLRPQQLITTLLAGSLLLAMSIAIWVGGDHFGAERLLQPFYPLLFVFAVSLWLERGGRIPALSIGRMSLLAIGALVLFAAPVRDAWYNIDRTDLRVDFELVREGRAKAGAIETIVRQAGRESLPVIASINAGGLKYYWPGSVFDLMGLNDVEMAHANNDRTGMDAHAAFDTGVFLRRLPEIVNPYLEGWPAVAASCAETRQPGLFYWEALDGLQGREDFTTMYTWVASSATVDAGEFRLCMYVRNDYLAELRAGGADLPAAD